MNLNRLFTLVIIVTNSCFAEGKGDSFSDRAHLAVENAVAACRDKGYRVTATVVNAEGLIVAVLRDTGATPHTLDSSRQKAYTAATLAPIVNLDKTSDIAAQVLSNPISAQLANLQSILLVGGGIAIRSNGQVVGGIGVGGAPGGNFDEACAAAGLEKQLEAKN